MPGTLFIVATPIGNLGDLTLRAQETLGSVDFIACEDTRRTKKLCLHLGIQKPLIRYDEFSHPKMAPQIVQKLEAGSSVALVSDAGTPGISDPGSRLIQAVMAARIPIIPIPGVSAVSTFISIAGFSGEGYIFLGFLPRKSGKAKRILQEALGLGRTIVLFESPFRIQKALQLIQECDPEAKICVAREMTKIFEEFIRGSISEVQSQIGEKKNKGEFVIGIEPNTKKQHGI